DRACLAVTIWLDREGNKRRHRFVRGLMRSTGNLTYGQVQRAVEGSPDAEIRPLVEPVIRPLYHANAVLEHARAVRQPLDVELPERGVVLGADGHVEAVRPRPHYESHRLIENFMIAANVAAAEELERLRQPCMYRVHEAPTRDKLEALREFLA